MPDCACKGCQKRHPGCHDKCPDYIRFKEELSKIRNKEFEEKRVGKEIRTAIWHQAKFKKKRK